MNFRTIALAPLSLIWWTASSIRNFLFDKNLMRPAKFSTPVIGLGNLSMGGTGKTPATLHVAEHLISRGKKVAILSRGYRRKVHGFQEVSLEGTAADFGDEPLMMKQRLRDGARVFVGEDRVMAMIRLMHDAPETEVVICDDVFQHRRLKPGKLILLTTYDEPFVEDFIFPSGTLRESRKGVKRADQVIITKCPETPDPRTNNLQGRIGAMTTAPVHRSWLQYRYDSAQGDGPIELPKNVLLVTGLANPDPLQQELSQSHSVTHIRFQDHHRFDHEDILKIHAQFDTFAASSKGVVTTEKDWVKIAPLLKPEQRTDWHVVKVEMKFDDESLTKVIDEYVDRED